MAYERSEHEKKYDRQMRLWGSHGQMKLETSHIGMIGSGATASEILKNLVLPNVGRFSLIDDHLTTMSDKNSNFFIDIHSVGRPRAEVVTQWMMEMNGDVKGEAVVKNARTLLDSNDFSYFSQFSLVVISDPTLPISSVLPLAAYLFEANIPLILVQVKGLIGSARLQVREHCIIESHPGSDRYDLYIHPDQSQHWPELIDYTKQFKVYRSDFETPSATTNSTTASSSSSSSNSSSLQPDSEEHAHIPYIAILAQEIARWQREHNGALPKTYDEKQSFKQGIRSTAWNGEESNFDEAIDFAHRAYDLPRFDRFVQAVFDDTAVTQDDTLKQSNFWLLVRSVKEFIAHEGHGVNYPVSPNLPDMHCKTAYYVALKELFQRKAEQDLDAVRQHLHRQLQRLDLPLSHVTEQELHMFVRNVRTIRVIRTRSLAEEYGRDGTSNGDEYVKSFAKDYIQEVIEEEVYDDVDEDDTDAMSDAPPRRPKLHNPKNIHWYLGLRAAELFHTKHGRIAGSGEGLSYQADGGEMLELLKQFLSHVGLSEVLPEPDLPVLGELVRAGASEPHITAAFMGGIVAQIALKLLLKQYVPLNNTFIWNGVFASSNTYNL